MMQFENLLLDSRVFVDNAIHMRHVLPYRHGIGLFAVIMKGSRLIWLLRCTAIVRKSFWLFNVGNF